VDSWPSGARVDSQKKDITVNRRALSRHGAGVGLVLVLAACSQSPGNAGTSASAQPTPTAIPRLTPTATPQPTPTAVPQPTQNGVTVGTTTGMLGTFLVGPDGKTVYLFEADTSARSTCSAACAQAWPPLTTKGPPVAGKGVTQSLLSTSQRSDGTTQVVYHGHPLYYFTGDGQPGDTKGEGLTAFGAGWDVVSPAGNKIEG
jgi:predicted lipoprotein with Yx(FWY)xxD motif